AQRIASTTSRVGPSPAVPALDTPRGLSPELRTMLADLAQALIRGNARDHEAVLSFEDDASMRRLLARAHQSGLTVLGQLGPLRAVRVRFESASALQRELIENGEDYSNIAANGLFGIPQPPAREDRGDVNQVPFGNDTLAFLGANGDRSSWGRGTTIAILDTGVAADTTFGAARVRALDIGLGTTPGAGSDDGHGTAIAALAAGLSPDAPGVAPAANLLGIRVTDTSGTSDLFTISQAIVAAVDAGAGIINVSLGGYSTGTVLDAAINYATQKGALIVAAAGNDQAAQLSWPAADPRVVSVGAIDKVEQQVSFSNSGPQLQLTAPGYGVQTAWLNGQRAYIDGTSASAPIVAGAIAAVISQNPSLTPRQAADLLARTANDGGAPGTDAAFGHGILNLATAFNRNNHSYVDTAVSSHHFDAESSQMQFVVQNRSGRAVSGTSLNVSVGTTSTSHTVPSLAAGETYVAKVPVSAIALKSAGSLSFTTQLTNPTGVVDQVPANNKRTSVLTALKPED
ncbi:MAG: S8 family peptidase, partial [Opitutaceae bacterium]